jgi:hypothetical protein
MSRLDLSKNKSLFAGFLVEDSRQQKTPGLFEAA